MKTIAVVNHKGGVGKSTVVTTLASCFANKDKKVLLGDFDIQQSSANWLTTRPEDLKKVHSWEFDGKGMPTPDADTDYLIIDTHAGLRSNDLAKIVAMSDKVIVPVRPGSFDIMSTETFLEEIVDMINAQSRATDICVIGNMVDARTKSSQQLLAFTSGTGLDNPTNIRQTQLYIHLAAHGMSVFDSASDLVAKDKEMWEPLIKWVEADVQTAG